MKRAAFFLALATCILACVGACGAQAPQTPSHPPPREVMALQIGVNDSPGETFCPALEAGLAKSGMAIANDTNADATLTCHAFFADDDGFFRVQVNGRARMRITVRIEVRSAQNQVVDQFIAEYKGYRGSAPDEDAIAKVVNALAYSPRIAAFARSPRAVQPAMTSAPTPVTADQAPTTDGRTMASRRDDQDWFAIDTVQCKIPARVQACDQVRRYLRDHPDGGHAQEANRILSAAEPALEKLQKDEIAWQKSNHSSCSTMKTSDACVAVEAYEIQFPSGIHSVEAHQLLKAAGIDK